MDLAYDPRLHAHGISGWIARILAVGLLAYGEKSGFLSCENCGTHGGVKREKEKSPNAWR